MILHVGYEIPDPEVKTLSCESEELTSEEVRILKKQIRKNTMLIDTYVQRLDLFVNQEQYPGHLHFVEKIRKRLFLLMEENDTFRRVLWKHFQRESIGGRVL